MNLNSEPILIIGTQRSGSNLLRLMLNQLPEIEAPHPPHILQTFFPLLNFYGDLNDRKNFRALVTDVCRFVNANPVPWQRFFLEPEHVEKKCGKKTLIEIYRTVYRLKAEDKKAKYWCCKSMANVHFIPQIEAEGLRPFYIHLERDGRDVAASFKNAIAGEKHIYFLAQQWKNEQELGIEMTSKYAPDRVVVLKYENFIRQPQTALLPVLDILGLQWNDDMLNYYQSEEAKVTAASGEMWRNVVKPIDSGNMRHYSERLSLEEIQIFEKVAGETLRKLGYATEHDSEITAKSFTESDLAFFKSENERMKKQAREKFTQDAASRKKQEDVLREIQARLKQS